MEERNLFDIDHGECDVFNQLFHCTRTCYQCQIKGAT